MASKSDPKTLSGKKLGKWKIKRVGNDKLEVTIPKGMKLQGDDISIEDIVAAGANYMVVREGRLLACCSGNLAIA
ncbi:MAG: hypothetical protein AAF223_04650 [Bacteroidota bacterium]